MLRTKLLFSLAVLALLAMYTPASAQVWTVSKFVADSPVAGDGLGTDQNGVKISGNIGLAGSFVASGDNTGKAYLFDVTTGLETFPLVPTGGVPSGALFGLGNSIDGNIAVVGARGADTAYLFDVSTGDEIGSISGSGGFGSMTAISGNTVIVGAEWTDLLYVYDVSDLVAGAGPAVQLGGIINETPHVNLSTRTLEVSGNTMITASTVERKAYVYDLEPLVAGTGPLLDPMILEAGDTDNEAFGGSVDIDGDIAVVGAIGADEGGVINTGAAYLFDVTTGTELARFVADDPQEEHRFGTDVGISGDTVIVGGSTRYAPGGTWNTPGEAYLFDISDTAAPTQIEKLTTTDGAGNPVTMGTDGFGATVDIEGGVALVGAPTDDEGAGNAGAVYIYTAPLAGLEWDGGIGNWADSNWSGGSAPTAEMGMVVNADTDDSVVTVAADFITGGTGPAASVFVGEEYAAKLVVTSGATLEVTGETTAGEFGKIAVENAATLQTGSAVIEIDGRLIAGVQGSTGDSGLVDSAGQMTIEDADAIQVDWMPGIDAGSMFGGTYTVAQYTGTALATTGTTTNADANIGTGYIKSVDYAADLGGGVLGVNVELQPQGLGDTDLDADVDGDDLATFGLAWAPSGTDKTWFDGDFDFDGDIDGDDLAALGLAWAPSGIDFPAGDLEVTAVPEPGSIIMLLIGAAGLLIYRKRR